MRPKQQARGKVNPSPAPQSKAAELHKTIDRGLEELAAALEKGQSEPLRQYLAVMGKFHRYSLGNQMLIAQQRPEARQVAGFHTWRQLGRHVQRGAKGIRILVPLRIKAKHTSNHDRGQHIQEGDTDEQNRKGQRLTGFRVASVFDVGQTTGEPLPEPRHVQGDPGAYLAKLESFIKSRGITLKRVPSLGNAEGASYGGRIEIRADLKPAEACSVLIHEASHEILHWPKEDKDQRPRLVQETEAEAVACVVSEALGLKAMDAAADYIQLYRGDKTTLYASLQRIQQAAREIIAGITTNDARIAASIQPTRTPATEG